MSKTLFIAAATATALIALGDNVEAFKFKKQIQKDSLYPNNGFNVGKNIMNKPRNNLLEEIEQDGEQFIDLPSSTKFDQRYHTITPSVHHHGKELRYINQLLEEIPNYDDDGDVEASKKGKKSPHNDYDLKEFTTKYPNDPYIHAWMAIIEDNGTSLPLKVRKQLYHLIREQESKIENGSVDYDSEINTDDSVDYTPQRHTQHRHNHDNDRFHAGNIEAIRGMRASNTAADLRFYEDEEYSYDDLDSDDLHDESLIPSLQSTQKKKKSKKDKETGGNQPPKFDDLTKINESLIVPKKPKTNDKSSTNPIPFNDDSDTLIALSEEEEQGLIDIAIELQRGIYSKRKGNDGTITIIVPPHYPPSICSALNAVSTKYHVPFTKFFPNATKIIFKSGSVSHPRDTTAGLLEEDVEMASIGSGKLIINNNGKVIRSNDNDSNDSEGPKKAPSRATLPTINGASYTSTIFFGEDDDSNNDDVEEQGLNVRIEALGKPKRVRTSAASKPTIFNESNQDGDDEDEYHVQRIIPTRQPTLPKIGPLSKHYDRTSTKPSTSTLFEDDGDNDNDDGVNNDELLSRHTALSRALQKLTIHKQDSNNNDNNNNAQPHTFKSKLQEMREKYNSVPSKSHTPSSSSVKQSYNNQLQELLARYGVESLEDFEQVGLNIKNLTTHKNFIRRPTPTLSSNIIGHSLYEETPQTKKF